MVEPDDIDDALARLHRLVSSLRETDRELFEGVTEVHLEACVEVRTVPRAGFLAFYNVLEGENLGGIATAIRGATERYAVAVRMDTTDEQETTKRNTRSSLSSSFSERADGIVAHLRPRPSDDTQGYITGL